MVTLPLAISQWNEVPRQVFRTCWVLENFNDGSHNEIDAIKAVSGKFFRSNNLINTITAALGASGRIASGKILKASDIISTKYLLIDLEGRNPTDVSKEYMEIIDETGKYLFHPEDPQHHYLWLFGPHGLIKNPATGVTYTNEPKWMIRTKCLLLFFFGFLLCVFVPLIKLTRYLYEYVKADSQSRPDIINKLKEAGEDLVTMIPRIIFGQIALTIIALCGIISPYEGRATYADVEKLFHGHALTAPCFQPNATEHLLGGLGPLNL